MAQKRPLSPVRSSGWLGQVIDARFKTCLQSLIPSPHPGSCFQARVTSQLRLMRLDHHALHYFLGLRWLLVAENFPLLEAPCSAHLDEGVVIAAAERELGLPLAGDEYPAD